MTRKEREAFEQARKNGLLGHTVVYGSAPATARQLELIRQLAQQRNMYESEAVKAVLGKNPVGGLNRERASRVIDWLLAQRGAEK